MNLLRNTSSVCPVCLKVIDAAYMEKDGHVYFEKSCKDHGSFSTLIANHSSDFLNWGCNVSNVLPKEALTKTQNNCPHDCGPCEQHLQTACCVLLELTKGCNQSCRYCFASANTDRSKDKTLKEIEKWYDHLILLGEERKFNIQLSGGEPTIREDLFEIIKMAKDKGFEYIQLNTNGKRIGLEEGYAKSLKEAGLTTVFLQFDGTTDEIYESLRGEKLLQIKEAAIANCEKAEIPVALVPTVVKGVNDENIGALYEFMLQHLNVVRGIHFQPVSYFGRYPSDDDEKQRVTMFDIINQLERQTNGIIKSGNLQPLSTGHNLCCFYGTFLKQENGEIKSLAKDRSKNQDDCCDCCTPDIDIVSKDRDFVLNKWRMAETDEAEDGFEVFLNHFRKNSFTLTGMAFQDAMNLDTERVKRCRVQVYSEEGTLVPFCCYNLTDLAGEYLYRGCVK